MSDTRTTPQTDVEVQLTGQDSNAFAIIGTVAKALKRAGHKELSEEFMSAAFASGSYDEVLRLCMKYVHVS